MPQPHIEVGSKETATTCLVWVRDNGIGFDRKYHDQIFGIFQRLNPIEEYPGTGIGLAIVRKAMERIGGRAWAESEPGCGATFIWRFLKLPARNLSVAICSSPVKDGHEIVWVPSPGPRDCKAATDPTHQRSGINSNF